MQTQQEYTICIKLITFNFPQSYTTIESIRPGGHLQISHKILHIMSIETPRSTEKNVQEWR